VKIPLPESLLPALTLRELAERWNTSPQALRTRMQTPHKMPKHFVADGRRIFFSLKDIADFECSRITIPDSDS
jgi:hypothetical protein